MPLSRSNTLRNKSRSPVPSTANVQGEFMHSQRTGGTQRPFLPPSHYAAAGGYLSPEHAFTKHYASGDMDLAEPHWGFGGEAVTFTPPLKSPRHDVDSRNDLQSRSHRDVAPRKAHHAGPMEGGLGTKQGLNKFSTHSREPLEYSNGFSNVESQIAPPLRNTIDRMTGSPHPQIGVENFSYLERRPPRLSVAPTSTASHDELLCTSLQGPSNHASYSLKQAKGTSERVNSPLTRKKSSLLPDAASPGLDRTGHRETKGMQKIRQDATIPHLPTRKEQVESFISPGPALRLPAKPALKHRGTLSTESQNGSAVPSQHNHHAQASHSMNPLRTVRSLLSRKNSNTMRSSAAGPKKTQMASQDDTPATAQKISRTGSVNPMKAKRHSSESVCMSTPHQQDQEFSVEGRSSSHFSTSSKSPFKSNIPRRAYRAKTHKYGDSSEDQASVSFDDSDLEVHCELERRGSRKLMVANGRPEASESGSILDSSSTSTATSGPDVELGFDAPFSYGHVVADEAQPNESASLDEEIMCHLDPPLYASSVCRNDGGFGLGVSVSPGPYYRVSPQPQHQYRADHVANTKKSFTQNRTPTLTVQHTQHGLTYSPFAPPVVASKPSFSPRGTPITSQEKTLRFSLPPSDSGVSMYSDEAVLAPDIEEDMPQTAPVYREERRALIDWNGRSSQHLGKPVTATGTGPQKSTTRNDPGAALDRYTDRTSPISRFSSPKNQQPAAPKYDSCDSEDAGYIKPRKKGSQRGKAARPRSASVGPRHRSLATEDEEEQFIHIPTKSTTHAHLDGQTPRPTSACQLSRRKNRSTERNGRERRPASQVFPAHLRNLIRDRTTSTHGYNYPDDHYQGQPNIHDEGYNSVSASEIASPIVSPAPTHQTVIHADRYREIAPSSNHTPVSTPRPKFHPPQPDLSGKDLRSIAARERLALGIPPSDSDEGVHSSSRIQSHDDVGDGEESSSGGLSHAESDMSSLNQSLWQAEEEQRREDDGHKLLENISWRVEGRKSTKENFNQPDSRDSLTTPRLSIISPTESGSSSCEGLYEPMLPATGPSPRSPENRFQPHEPQTTSDYALNSKLAPHTALPSPSTDRQPQTREAVIQELFESEEALLHLLHICVNNFILPLRVQNSSAWISGVPSSISKLLDWFDDIVHLHEGVHAGLCAARDMQTAESERVSEVLRECFILRVEVYMPYFMRINDVLDEVVALVGRQYVDEGGLVANNAGVGARKSEFAQFILLQERTAECQGWTLDGLLRLPLQRLEVYQSLFAKMLQLTPKSHQDYLSTLSLSRSTDIAMQVMMEVKFREDEYRLLRSFAKRIKASSSLDHLSTRERRLLFSGPCLLLQPGYLLSSVAPSPGTPHDQTRGSYVTEAGIQRSDSIRSASSMPAQEGRRNPSSKSSWFSLLPRRKRNKTKCSVVSAEDSVTASGSLSDPEEISSLEGTPLYAFVFNDLILLAHAHDNNAENAPWQLFEDSGIVKPILISHFQHPKVQADSLVSMDVVVLDIENINDPAEDFSRYSHRQLDFVFKPPPPGSADQEKKKFLTSDSLRSALTACRSTVLKWLSIPKYCNAPNGLTGAVTDHALDTQEIVSSLIMSGLPFPRSPSGQILDGRHCGTSSQVNNHGDERVERGWWSLCYQRSMRELQREDW